MYKLKLEGDDNLKKILEREKVKREEIDAKWERLELALFESQNLAQIFDYVQLNKPKNWNEIYDSTNKIDISFKVPGYVPISTEFTFDKEKLIWVQGPYYIVRCIECGESYRTKELATALALGWKHYTHL